MPLTQVQGQMLNGSNNTTTTIQSNGTTAITIDSTQNVGIGNTVASIINAANGVGNLVVGSGSGSEGITIYTGTTDTGGIAFADGTTTTDTYRGYINYAHSTDHMAFWTAATERMRITSTGQVNLTRPVGDDTQINFLQMQGGGTSGGAVDNLSLLSRYTASVSTSTKPIFGGPPRGSIVVVTGYTGASYFSDILNCSSNTVTVISSQNSTGSPASRTYSIVSFLLNLQMGSGTYDVGVLLLGTQPRY